MFLISVPGCIFFLFSISLLSSFLTTYTFVNVSSFYAWINDFFFFFFLSFYQLIFSFHRVSVYYSLYLSLFFLLSFNIKFFFNVCICVGIGGWLCTYNFHFFFFLFFFFLMLFYFFLSGIFFCHSFEPLCFHGFFYFFCLLLMIFLLWFSFCTYWNIASRTLSGYMLRIGLYCGIWIFNRVECSSCVSNVSAGRTCVYKRKHVTRVTTGIHERYEIIYTRSTEDTGTLAGLSLQFGVLGLDTVSRED